MTDKDELTALLTRWGVPFTEPLAGNIQVIKGEPESPKVTGYYGFLVNFEFDKDDGSFQQIGIYE